MICLLSALTFHGLGTQPVTQENWEGRGVRPHVEVPAKSALEAAHRVAIERLARRE